MSRLLYSCPTCHKTSVEVQSEIDVLGLVVYTCGHTDFKKPALLDLTSKNGDLFKSVSGEKEAYEFQKDGIRFAELTNFNVLLADAMGLGKTIQALLIFKRNRKTLGRTLVLTRSSIIFQWAREYHEWVNGEPFTVMPIINRSSIIPGFDFYVMSMDLIGRKGIIDLLRKLNISTVILDEVHFFKDSDSVRTKALIKFITENRIEHKIALSGTPIKNRASEYFTILNLLAPEYFRSPISFKRQWLIPNEKGVYTRVDPYLLEDFHKLISKWVIRREKKDVLTNLPPLTRDYQLIEIEDENLKKSYNKELDLFANFLRNTANITSVDILGWLAKIRAITGQAKCQAALDWSQEFLDSSDESLAIGIHHQSVRDTLYYVFTAAGYEPLKLSGEDNSYAKERIVQRFNTGVNRLLIINSLAGGIGLNLQVCSNALILERQWNAADEEQFEGRFHRDGQKNPVMCTYMIAKGTIDEWFHDMVVVKRQIFGETMGDKFSFTSDDNSIKELMNKTLENRL